MTNMQFGVELFECLVVELSAISSDEDLREPESTDDGLLEKIDLTLLSVTCAKGSASIHLEVINGDEQVSPLARC